MEQPINKGLLKKFLNNTCTAYELVRVREFLQRPNADEILHGIMIEDAGDTWNDPEKGNNLNEQKILDWKNKVHQRISASQQPTHKVYKLSFLKYAAIWAAGIFIVGGYGLYLLKKQQQPISADIGVAHTAAGKLVKLQLADSTIVYLNALSNLKYPKNFTGKFREVELSGEAFFEVKHDSRHPFLVHTDQLKVQVLGTSFNIRSYNNDKDVAVTVATGKVGVSVSSLKNLKAQILLPDKQFTYYKESEKFKISDVNAEDSKSWETGLFIFNYESLENITNRLARWYGVTFIIKKQVLMHQKYRLKQKNVDLNTVMESLSSADQGFHYEIKDKKVIIW